MQGGGALEGPLRLEVERALAAADRANNAGRPLAQGRCGTACSRFESEQARPFQGGALLRLK